MGNRDEVNEVIYQQRLQENQMVSTVVTADHFQHYIPTFIYSLLKATGYRAKVFVRGKLDNITIDALGFIEGEYDIVENYLPTFPDHISTTNCMRFLIPYKYFGEPVFITDVDFVFFAHDPSFMEYYQNKAKKWEECYWSRRGPKSGKGRAEHLKRIAGGCFYATEEWFKKTSEMRKKMYAKVCEGKIGKYREDDEVMLWDICAGSGLKCPTKRGNTRKKKYKELHLGDHKFEGRVGSNRKMRKRIPMSNLFKWYRLQEDKTWLKIREIVSQDEEIANIFESVDTYMAKRLRKYNESKCDNTNIQA